jgi:transcriptional regulator with XRE-family HTH domain
MGKVNESLARRLQRRLDALETNAEAASLKAGMGRDVIRNVFEGRSYSPKGTTIAKLAKALKTTPQWLLNEDGPETPEISFFEQDSPELTAAIEGSITVGEGVPKVGDPIKTPSEAILLGLWRPLAGDKKFELLYNLFRIVNGNR